MRFRVSYEVLETGDIGVIQERTTYIEVTDGEGSIANRLTLELRKLHRKAWLISWMDTEEEDMINSIADYFF